MTRLMLLVLMIYALAAPGLAQQNQTPGDTNAGGQSRSEASGLTAALGAQSGANTSDATTTGASGPKKKGSGPPGGLALPPLPSDALCAAYQGEVLAACLSTTLNAERGAAP